MKKVMIFGTFDILHKGHLDFCRQAKDYGDFLVVVVARDSTVKKVKGEFPLNDENSRFKALEDCGLVDKVVLGRKDDKYDIVVDEEPDVLCLGYDQTSFTNNLEGILLKKGLNIDVVRLTSFKPEKYKSSLLKENIKKERV